MKRILTGLITAGLAILPSVVWADTLVPAMLTTDGGPFPCAAGLTDFCDGSSTPTYLLVVHGSAAAYTLTVTLADGTISVLIVGVTAPNRNGWQESTVLDCGGVVISYAVSAI